MLLILILCSISLAHADEDGEFLAIFNQNYNIEEINSKTYIFVLFTK